MNEYDGAQGGSERQVGPNVAANGCAGRRPAGRRAARGDFPGRTWTSAQFAGDRRQSEGSEREGGDGAPRVRQPHERESERERQQHPESGAGAEQTHGEAAHRDCHQYRQREGEGRDCDDRLQVGDGGEVAEQAHVPEHQP